MEAGNRFIVKSLIMDIYKGNRNKRIETLRPTLAEVTEAVKSLNGGSKSSLCMLGSDDSVLCAGGGGLYGYSVQVTLRAGGGGPHGYEVGDTLPDKVFVLCDPTKPDDQQVNIIIGSIWTPLAANFIVDQRTAMTAVEYHFSRGTLASSLEWVES
jgi:hypothetical protein